MRAIAEEIKGRLLISSLISRVVALKARNSNEFTGLCPFHSEKTPSFSVSDNKGFYHCFGCGAHGDVFKFIMETQRVSYQESLEILGKEAGVSIPKRNTKLLEVDAKLLIYQQIFELSTSYYQQQLTNNGGKSALSYLKNRGLNNDVIQTFRLGFAPKDSSQLLSQLKKNFSEEDIIKSTVFQKDEQGSIYSFFRSRIIFPIINRKNKVIAFGGRIIMDGQPKYLNSPDNPLFKKGLELYNFNFALNNLTTKREVLIVEGYMDVITLSQFGFKNVVAPLGTALKSSQIELVWQLNCTPVLCFDNDIAGQKAIIKTCKEAIGSISSEKTLKIINIAGAKDPDEFLHKNGAKTFQNRLTSAVPLCDYLFEYEKNSDTLKTPEQKSNFKKRLLALTEQIKDLDLRSQYKKYFLDQFFQNFYRKSANTNINANIDNSLLLSESAINTTMEHKNSNIKLILYIITLYPSLLKEPQVIEELTRIEIFNKELDKTRNDLLYAAENSIIDNKLNVEQNIKITAEALAKSPAISRAICVSKINTEVEALKYIMRLFKLNTLNKLEYDIEVILKELNHHPTDKNFNIFIGLKKVVEQLKIELGII